MGIRCRGVDEIRTLAKVRGSGAHSSERHVHQFQVASLELERTRRIKERQTTLRRVQEIDSRLCEIDELLIKHYATLGLVSVQSAEPGAPSAHAAEHGPQPRSQLAARPASIGCDRHVLRY